MLVLLLFARWLPALPWLYTLYHIQIETENDFSSVFSRYLAIHSYQVSLDHCLLLDQSLFVGRWTSIVGSAKVPLLGWEVVVV